ncbi:alpha/beta fold hydrolase [Desulfovulcanus sp.]
MTDVLFISGWAGYPFLYPALSRSRLFLLPFVQDSPEKILAQARSFKGSTIIAWSTGAHILLSQLSEIKDKNIFLLAPFLDFTSFTPEWILNRMIQGIKEDVHKVVSRFWKKCGIKEHYMAPEEDAPGLIDGLKFLACSKIKLEISELNSKIFIIHGQEDKIVPLSATKQLSSLLPEAEFIVVPAGHYIPEETIKQLVYAKTDTKIF